MHWKDGCKGQLDAACLWGKGPGNPELWLYLCAAKPCSKHMHFGGLLLLRKAGYTKHLDSLVPAPHDVCGYVGVLGVGRE